MTTPPRVGSMAFQPSPRRTSMYLPAEKSFSCTPIHREGGSLVNPLVAHAEEPYLQTAKEDIRKVLQDLGYSDVPLKDNFFKKPTNKEFYSICHFFYKQIDPIGEASMSSKKDDENVFSVAENFRYPTRHLRKSDLKSVTAPGTLPRLIKFLHWLTVLYRIKERRVELFDSMIYLKQTMQMFRMKIQGYDTYKTILQDQLASIARERIPKEERIRDEEQHRDGFLAKCRKAQKRIEEYTNQMNELEHERDQVAKLHLQRNQKRLKWEQRKEEWDRVEHEVLVRRTERKAEVDDLRHRIAQQKYTVEEENEKLARREELREEYRRLQKQERVARDAYQESIDTFDESGRKLAPLKRENMSLEQVRRAVMDKRERSDALKRTLEERFQERATINLKKNQAEQELEAENEKYLRLAEFPGFPPLADATADRDRQLQESKMEEERRRIRLQAEIDETMSGMEEAERQTKEKLEELTYCLRGKKMHFERLALKHWNVEL